MEKGMCKQGIFVKNQINGYEGFVLGKIYWLYGCEKLILTPVEVNHNNLLFSLTEERIMISEEFVEPIERKSEYERDFVVPNTDKWFGRKCRDKVTGVEGICIACMSSLFSADQYALERLDKKGRPTHDWFDEGRLVDLGIEVTAEAVASPSPGGTDISLPTYVLPIF